MMRANLLGEITEFVIQAILNVSGVSGNKQMLL